MASPFRDVHVVTAQDTDVTAVRHGRLRHAARARPTSALAIAQTGALLKERILKYACELTRQMPALLDIVDGRIIRRTDGRADDARRACHGGALQPVALEHLTAESTYQIKNNAYSFGCSFAEVEVDIPCEVVAEFINVHDCGKLINPQFAEARRCTASMAIGYGMSEELKFDPKTGCPLNNNLLITSSTMMDHPHLEAQFVENAEPTNPYARRPPASRPPRSGAPAIRNAIPERHGHRHRRRAHHPQHVLFAAFEKAGLFGKGGNRPWHMKALYEAVCGRGRRPASGASGAQIIAGGSDVPCRCARASVPGRSSSPSTASTPCAASASTRTKTSASAR